LKFNPEDNKGPIESGKYYVLLDATSSDGNNHYYYVVEATTDGTKVKELFKIEDKWSGGQPFSNNWKDIKTSVITPKPGQTIETGGVEPNASTYDKCPYSIGEYLYTTKRETETDDVAHIQHEEFVVELKKANLESALEPYNILGDAMEFGIVADTYENTVHTETNFAVNHVELGDAVEIDGSGDNDIPFYVGDIKGSGLRIGERNIPKIDIYTPEDEFNKVNNESTCQITHINTTKEQVSKYVDDLIRAGRTKSATMATKTTIKPAATTSNADLIDTRSFPDGTTIYVDCS
jgi:hypothetical protein